MKTLIFRLIIQNTKSSLLLLSYLTNPPAKMYQLCFRSAVMETHDPGGNAYFNPISSSGRWLDHISTSVFV